MHRRFVKDFSRIAWPPHDFLQKDRELDWQDTITEALNASDRFKSKLLEPPMLARSQLHRVIMIDTDASVDALGSVLLQQQRDSNLVEWAKIGYRKRTLNQAGKNYLATEMKCHAVV